MQAIIATRPLNRWDHDSMRPGPVGSTGDALMQTRLKTSMHGMPMRWYEPTAHERECRLGSNVSDGQERSYTSGGACAAVHDSNWGYRQTFKTQRGWVHEDIRAPDRATQEMMGGLPQYSWHNTLATVHHARVSGDNFLPLPGGYGLAPGEDPRGGSAPRVTDRTGPSAVPLEFSAQVPLDAAKLKAANEGNYGAYNGVRVVGPQQNFLTPSNLNQAYRQRVGQPGAGGMMGNIFGIPGAYPA